MNCFKILGMGIALVTISSCSTKFLEEKRDLTGMNEEVFQDEGLATAYVDYVYRLFLPADNANAFIVHQTSANGGYNDAYTKTSEELAGQTDFNRPWAAISIRENHANQYFGQRLSTSIANNTWTRLKQINIFLEQIEQHGLAKNVTDPLKGQMYFWRGYQYFELLRLYGGVPLVLKSMNPIQDENNPELQVPRSSSEETLNQVLADLDSAAALLPANWSANSWGRITSAGAMALKGRVLLTWASPLFNRDDDVTRWQRAYDANAAARTFLEANGYGLFTAGGFANATAWGNMWFQEQGNPEAVIVYNFNTVTSDQTQRNNGWEQAVRPRQINGAGSISPTKQMVDAFPMKDGRMPGESSYAYDPQKFYKNRDPRFYKTFAYNGAVWPYQGNANYRIWTYSWYNNSSATVPNRFTEVPAANASGIYLRKASNPAASNSVGSFEFSGTDFMELRFTEVLMNLAEAAIGIGNLGEGLDLIKRIRERAGVEVGDGHYGLADAAGNRDRMFAAVLNERKIEFAYEDKRFWDLRRWMLFTDDYGTCSRLGMEPINGMRRTGYWITVKNNNGTRYENNGNAPASDPLLRRTDGTAAVVDREPLNFPPGYANQDEYLDYLYDNYFVISERDNLDPTNPSNWVFTWYNEYYFFGLHQNILTGGPYLRQTVGWPGLTGEAGTFDPLQ